MTHENSTDKNNAELEKAQKKESFEKYLSQQNKQVRERLAGKVWRASTKQPSSQARSQKTLSTGHPPLDKLIQGWRLGITTEIGIDQTGIGELRLLIPAIKALQTRPRGPKQVLWIAPPLIPFAPALNKAGVDLSHLHIIQAKNIKDTLWACEQALASGGCAATICWTHNHPLKNREIRRLQLAAEQHNSWHILFRSHHFLQQSSVSNLRLQLSTNKRSQLNIKVVKQPNSWGGQTCTISLPPRYENWQRLPVDLLPVPHQQRYMESQVKLRVIPKHEHKVTLIMALHDMRVVC